MKRIQQTWTINAPLDTVWRAFVDPKIIEQWGGGPAKMDDKLQTKFELWEGSIFGSNTKVIKAKLLEQDWTSGNWEQPSKVSFSFSAKGDKTIVRLTHSNVPDYDTKDIERGWQDYYLGPIKELLEQ